MRYIVENAMVLEDIYLRRISSRHFQEIDVNAPDVITQVKTVLEDLGLPTEDLQRTNGFRIDGILFHNESVHINFVPKWAYKHLIVGFTYRKLGETIKYFTAGIGQAAFEQKLISDTIAVA